MDKNNKIKELKKAGANERNPKTKESRYQETTETPQAGRTF
jgi:hypothetical protein